ncbi:prolipoprotein diacylglyceryl transferase [Boudabousia liubingyangii]|uniref:Phosphatidylglycerol--prolipoprotein diacylglyceryl transferase n=1 Tax=Boudabousia liubingyangii TaxID=1921764 RepID=A0A1Q5PND1_9ACTO|nr:prolipoprotein diacylglyceryl transferase [Boudabousia liubingyangii]OKL47622.1 prolipoprotein diacylglyceryl transferase [Boudabousia liubingyangii]OKL49047.1 prolipoprotein diacylglyceryl transferase [Boudabousia liubingyangii]
MFTLPLSIPSPSQSVWYLGPLPLRAYALFILCGILLTLFWGNKRYADRGGDPELIWEVAIWAVPMGIIGGRLYEVATSPSRYFPPSGSLWLIPQVWLGGMGIMGAIILGCATVWLVMRHHHARVAPFFDSLAPAVLVAQAVGRLGNYFNQELFGLPTTLPWGLQIDDAHLPAGYPSGTLFHPTFLYELIWNLLGALVLVWMGKHLKLYAGQLAWAYLIVYGLGRAWIENVRIDEPAHWVGPLRLASWFALSWVLVGILGWFWAKYRAEPSTLTTKEVESWQEAERERAGK